MGTSGMRRRVERLETRRRAGDEPGTSQIEALSDDRLLVLSRPDAAGRAEALRTGRPLRVREMTDDELAMLAGAAVAR